MRVRAMKSGGGAKARGVEQALDHIWPDKIPEGLSAKERNNTVREWLIAKRLSVPNDIAKAIQRALNARQLRKNKTVGGTRHRPEIEPCLQKTGRPSRILGSRVSGARTIPTAITENRTMNGSDREMDTKAGNTSLPSAHVPG